IVFVNSTAGEFDSSPGRSMAFERTRVFGLKTKLNRHHPRSMNHLLHKVTVSGERSDKRPNELSANCFLSRHEGAGSLKHHIFCIERHDAIQIPSAPGVVVLFEKRVDVK